MTGLLCKNPRIVLILGTGYLGKALAESLRKAGHTARWCIMQTVQ